MSPHSDSPERARTRVAVIFGGSSSEHSISCLTAGGVLDAIDRSKYDVVTVGIAQDGTWLLDAVYDPSRGLDACVLPGEDSARLAVVPKVGSCTLPTEDAEPRLIAVDVLLPLLHGPWGEDGTVQGLAELMLLPYAGSGVLASAVAMDKDYAKRLLRETGLPVTEHLVCRPMHWDEQERRSALDYIDGLGYPVFVKPARGGSSVGVSEVRHQDDITGALEYASRFDAKVIVERAVTDCRELECGVLGGIHGDDTRVSDCGEVVFEEAHQFYDFDAKYDPREHTRIEVPARLPPGLNEQIREMARRAFRVLGCEGLARVDFLLDPAGNVYVNEVNTMPGATPTSVFPRLWAASGLTFTALIDAVIEQCVGRTPGRLR